MRRRCVRLKIQGLALVLLLVSACGVPGVSRRLDSTPAAGQPPASGSISTLEAAGLPATPTPERRTDGLTGAQAATLGSLAQVDDYPLYTMHYQGAYEEVAAPVGLAAEIQATAWGCSLFAALADTGNMVYGRNFDWEFSPALLLFTDPPDGYASVTMVDLAYFFEPDQVGGLTDLPPAELRPLLETPLWPFDGMNERGLAVGMAAVPGSTMPDDPRKETIDSLRIIREMLDHARDVAEALDIMESYNLRWGGGPPLHYLIADAMGRAVLVEFFQGEMVTLPNEESWHQATNFLLSQAGQTGDQTCWRYDRIAKRLAEVGGRLSAGEAMELLAGVAQGSTQWSVVYGLESGRVDVVMGREYGDPHSLILKLAGR
jgi:hypothetical protein